MSRRYQAGFVRPGYDPLKVPNAPTIGTAVKGDASASVAFTAPSDVGGSAITSYTAVSNPGSITGTGASSPITVSGLTNGTPYTFQVTALNTYGPSLASAASNSVTPVAPVGWIGILSSASSDIVNSLAVDSSGNVYISGYTNQGGTYGYETIKLNNLGAIQWQRKLTGSYNGFGLGGTVDSSGNVYTVGYASLDSYKNSEVLAKYNSSGSLQWQSAIPPNNGNVYGYSVTTDSSGNVYTVGNGAWTGNSSWTCGYYSKYNSSGALQVVKALKVYTEFTMRSDGAYGVTVDSSGNIYVCGYRTFFNGLTYRRIFVTKFDSAHNVVWVKELVGNNDDYSFDLVLNSSGDIYVAAQTKSGTDQCLLLKYNNSGTLLWQRQLGTAGSSGGWRKIALDSSGNVYCVGYYSLSGNAEIIIAKYNSSGTLQWQRRLAGPGTSNDYGQGVATDSSGNVYVCGYITNAGDDMLVAKLPGDGSATGTYTVGGATITYAATTLTDSTPSYTETTPSFAGGDVSRTTATPTLTDSASTLTASVTQI